MSHYLDLMRKKSKYNFKNAKNVINVEILKVFVNVEHKRYAFYANK